MKKIELTKEYGQVLVFVALIMIALMAMLALALDGGNVLSKRRAAQNAADAGALAGADIWCSTQDATAARSAALLYATSLNEGNTADVAFPASPDTGLITVTAHIPVDTFFAHFLGFDVITATAQAAAGCYSSCEAENVLPVAWNCRPTVAGPTPDPDDPYECEQEIITLTKLYEYRDLDNFASYHPELYIVMDTYSYGACDLNDPNCTASTADFYCKEDYPGYGELTCDVDGDGKVDWLGAGGRSWIDLDGSAPSNPYDCSVIGKDDPNLTDSGGAELGYWILNGFGCLLENHTWLPEITGVSGDLFKDTESRRKDYPWVTIPVFDDFCIGHPYDPQDGTCVGKGQGEHGIDQYRYDPAAQPVFFHIADFSYFYITCVTRQGSMCPGVKKIEELNSVKNGGVISNGDIQAMQAIEGYFVEAFDPDLGGRCDGIGTGSYQIYLAR